MAAKFIKCDPVFCKVCGGQIARRPKEQPSQYLKRKYHTDKPSCVKGYRKIMSAKVSARQKGKRRKPVVEGQFMSMPVIEDRSTNY